LAAKPLGSGVIIIPTYNEASNIEKLLCDVSSIMPHWDILIVDDNSPDGTGDVCKKLFQKMHCGTVLVREKRDGLGSAYCSGFQLALENKYKFIIQMDADSSHDPHYLPIIEKHLTKYDVVVGSRYLINGMSQNSDHYLKSWFSRWVNHYLRLTLRLHLSDCTSGFKGYRCDVLKVLPYHELEQCDFSFQFRIAHFTQVHGLSVLEIPINFAQRASGSSKVTLKTIVESIRSSFELMARNRK